MSFDSPESNRLSSSTSSPLQPTTDSPITCLLQTQSTRSNCQSQRADPVSEIILSTPQQYSKHTYIRQLQPSQISPFTSPPQNTDKQQSDPNHLNSQDQQLSQQPSARVLYPPINPVLSSHIMTHTPSLKSSSSSLSASSSSNSSNQQSSGLLRKRVASSDQLSRDDSVAKLKALKHTLKGQRKRITLFKAPIATLYTFSLILLDYLRKSLSYLLHHHILMYSLLSVLIVSVLALSIPGPQEALVRDIQHFTVFALWWIGLGVLSSVGLGTGLHTFVLYLGPHIATVTLAVTECNTLNIETSGSHAFKCPVVDTEPREVTFFGIWSKIALASFLWGLGTAIGELPPYFVSRAATLSGQKLAELEDIDETMTHLQQHQVTSFTDRVKQTIFSALQTYGFWSILCFASIPNPLFDLAGLTCGHFLIDFWVFFGATLIGKAVFKVNIQSCLVILAFSKDRLTLLIETIETHIPKLNGTLTPFFEQQRHQFHLAGSNRDSPNETSLLSIVWNGFLVLMILFFVKSIIDSSVQERLALQDQQRIEKFKHEHHIQDKNDNEED